MRFFRRLQIIPGLRFNLSKRGTSFSVGAHGFTVSRNWVTASLLGKGLNWWWPRWSAGNLVKILGDFLVTKSYVNAFKMFVAITDG